MLTKIYRVTKHHDGETSEEYYSSMWKAFDAAKKKAREFGLTAYEFRFECFEDLEHQFSKHPLISVIFVESDKGDIIVLKEIEVH